MPPPKKKPAINMDTADLPVLNTFTKSYTNRYVVHASRKGDKLTVCGRKIFQQSEILFDKDRSGSCRKCIQKMKVELRIHPGWKK